MAIGEGGGGGDLVGIGARLSVSGAGAFASDIGRAASAVDRFGNIATANFKRIGAVMTVFGGSITAAAVAMGGASAEFEADMRNVQTISLAAQADFEGMSQGVLDVARDVNKSGEEAAEGMYQVVSSGFDGAEALGILEQGSRAASAGLTTVFTASSALLAVLNAYGLSAEHAGDVSDILFQTVNLGVGSFEELAQSVGQVVGLASQAGVGFDEIGAAISAVSRSGINFEEAATGVNRILVEMLQPSDQLQEMLGRLGYSSGLAALQQDGLRGVLEKIRGEIGGNAAAYVTLFGRIEATRSALALAANDGETYATTTAAIADAQARAGAAAKAFEIQQRAVKAQLRDVLNSLVSLGQSGLTPLIGLFARVLAPIKAVIDFIDRLPAPLKAAVSGMGLFLGAMTLLVGGAFLALPRIVIVAALAMLRYNTAMMTAARTALQAASANSILAASLLRVADFALDATFVQSLFHGFGKGALAVGAVTAAMVLLTNNTKNASEWVAELNQELTDSEARNKVMELVEALEFKDVPGGKEGILERIFGDTLDDVDDLLGKVGLGFGSAQNKAEEAMKGFRELARTNIETARRLYDSARAAGTNSETLDEMKAALLGAEKAAKDTADSAAYATNTYTDSAGQMLLVTDDVKEALDDFRTRADDIRHGFHGLFDDPADSAADLAAATRDAQQAVADALAGVDKARNQDRKDNRSQVRDEAKAERDLAKARREASQATADRPRRQRGESVEEYRLRIQERVEDANQRVVDAEDRLTEIKEKAEGPTDRVSEAEKRLADAREKATKAQDAELTTADELVQALRSQHRVLSDMFSNLGSLERRGLTKPILDELRELGPEGAAQIAALNSATDAELAEYRSLWEKNNSLAQGIAFQGITVTDPAKVQAQLAELWTATGGDIGEFLRLGAGAGEKALQDFVENKIRAAADQARQALVAALPPEWVIKVKPVLDEVAAGAVREQITKPIIEAYMTGSGTSANSASPGDTPEERKEAAIQGYVNRNRRKPFAKGGVEDHRAQIAAPGEWRVWAEPETGGEAYIPLGMHRRVQSMPILREAAHRLGADVVPMATGGLRGLSTFGGVGRRPTWENGADKLSDKDPRKEAMRQYTSSSSFTINQYLRKTLLNEHEERYLKAHMPKIKETIHGLDDAIQTGPRIPRNVSLHRAAQLPQDVFDRIQPGREFSDPGFTSTTRDPLVQDKFENANKRFSRTGVNTRWTIDMAEGSRGLSFPNGGIPEQEVLLRRGAPINVQSVNRLPGSGGYEIRGTSAGLMGQSGNLSVADVANAQDKWSMDALGLRAREAYGMRKAAKRLQPALDFDIEQTGEGIREAHERFAKTGSYEPDYDGPTGYSDTRKFRLVEGFNRDVREFIETDRGKQIIKTRFGVETIDELSDTQISSLVKEVVTERFVKVAERMLPETVPPSLKARALRHLPRQTHEAALGIGHNIKRGLISAVATEGTKAAARVVAPEAAAKVDSAVQAVTQSSPYRVLSAPSRALQAAGRMSGGRQDLSDQWPKHLQRRLGIGDYANSASRATSAPRRLSVPPMRIMASGGVLGHTAVSGPTNSTSNTDDHSTHVKQDVRINRLVSDNPRRFKQWTDRQRRQNNLSGADIS